MRRGTSRETLISGRPPNGTRVAAAIAALCAATPIAIRAQDAPTTIPLCDGLKIVTAINQANGDYESIKTIENASGPAVRLKYTSERLVTDFLSEQFGEVAKTTVYRSILREDLAASSLFQQRYFEEMPETIPGSTAIGISSADLTRLKAGTPVELGISNAYSGEFGTDENVRPNIYDFQTPGTIARAQPASVMLPVLVNDVQTELPAIHASGDFGGEAAEFFFLDDPGNPLALKFRLGIGAVPPMVEEMVEQCREMANAAPELAELMCSGGTEASDSEVLQVVSITYRCGAPVNDAPPAGGGGLGGGSSGAPAGAAALSAGAAALEEALAETGTVAIYDIFFSFNSAAIREESAPRLREIADVLAKHPDWRLAVNGHTDSIASDEYNLDLSQRRAAAVKDALVTRHGIDPAQLLTAGYGEGQPRDTNDTLEGRARNRRVELIKQ